MECELPFRALLTAPVVAVEEGIRKSLVLRGLRTKPRPPAQARLFIALADGY